MALDPDFKKWLENRFKNNVKFNESMAGHTSFRVGGPADAYVLPERLEDLVELVNRSRQNGLPYTVIGGGTNLLVKDSGICGIVICLAKCLKKITAKNAGNRSVMVTAMAGARTRALCRFAIDNGLKGMNFALGIPGTVGGAIMMNAGTIYGSMEGVLDSINVLMPTGQIKKIKRENIDFSYRSVTWDEESRNSGGTSPIILEGCFRLYASDSTELKTEAEAILKIRKKRQPISSYSAGCFFKNPESGKPAGQLIEMAGLKGKKIGGAQVSRQHANFIINRVDLSSGATAADILELMDMVQKSVSKMFDVKLEPEVKIVGT